MSSTLERINLHYYASIRVSISERFRSPIARYALYHVEHYLNGLITQWNRIADDMDASAQLSKTDLVRDKVAASIYSQIGNQEDVDVHFFLICWDKIHKFLDLFDQEQRDPVISGVCSEISTLLERGTEARNYFEHLDDRLRGGGGHTHARFGGGGDAFVISYEGGRLAGGIVQPKSDSFGREEIRRVAAAYNRILEQLGAKLQPSYLGTEIPQLGAEPPGKFP